MSGVSPPRFKVFWLSFFFKKAYRVGRDKVPAPAEQIKCQGFHPQHPRQAFYKKLDQKFLNIPPISKVFWLIFFSKKFTGLVGTESLPLRSK